MPVDYRTALTDRLTAEFDDPTLAASEVRGLGDDQIAKLQQRVPLDEVGTSPFLAYRPPTAPADSITAIVAFSFGNRVGADGTTTAGPTNEALADTIVAFVAAHPVPVYAQWEIADILTTRGVPDVSSIGQVIAADGATTYLSTAGVAAQIVSIAQTSGKPLGTVGIVAFADHAVRCILTAQKAGMPTAVVPAGVVLPTTYDPQSGQSWTRDRSSYLAIDLIGRLATL